MSDAIPFQALKGEGDNEPFLGEGGDTLVLPEYSPSAPLPPIPPPPVPAIVHLCPGVECCDPSPFSYSIRRAAPTLEMGAASGDAVCSTCLNEAYSVTITATGIGPALTWTIDSGFLPPGLIFHGGYNEDGEVLIDGTPTAGGNYSIVVKATSPTGAFATSTFPFSVLGITSGDPPAYVVGEPYFYQLTAAGGSGNYGWSIDSGVLPDGLVFNPVTGIVNGTPTGVNTGSMPIEFTVIDITCEKFNPFFVPQVSLLTSSNTTVATVLGYDEYIPSSPPKRYHSVTWSGTSEQQIATTGSIQDPTSGSWQIPGSIGSPGPPTFNTPAPVLPAGAARIVWSGTGTIDSQGLPISSYTKEFFAQCNNLSVIVGTGITPAGFIDIGFRNLCGWCWAPDPVSCATCSGLNDYGNISQNNSSDQAVTFTVPNMLHVDGSLGFQPIDSTHAQDLTAGTVVVSINDPRITVFPEAYINFTLGKWVQVSIQNNYQAELFDEYTDAEALANATHLISNSRMAESFPRTTGFVSQWTSVNFDMNCSNLSPGATYVVTVRYLDSDGTISLGLFSFTATATTHTVNAQVPTPSDGHTLRIASASIAFV